MRPSRRTHRRWLFPLHDFVDRFAVVGPPDHCIAHLRALKALGLDKVAISGGTRGASAEDAAVGRELVARHVLPAMAA